MNEKILKYPDPRLFQLSGFVRDFKDPKFLNITDKLFEIVDDVDEKILCALQIGFASKVLVFVDKFGKKILMANPSVFSHDSKQTISEHCVSFDDLKIKVERFNKIRIIYQDINGEQCFYESSSFESANLQRTINMMHGELLVDKLTKKQKIDYDKNISFDSSQICPASTHRSKFIIAIRVLLSAQALILLTKNLFDFSFELSFYNLLLTILGFILLMVYAFYAKYETAKYKNCTSCQGANMIGNFVGYSFGLILLYLLIHFV